MSSLNLSMSVAVLLSINPLREVQTIRIHAKISRSSILPVGLRTVLFDRRSLARKRSQHIARAVTKLSFGAALRCSCHYARKGALEFATPFVSVIVSRATPAKWHL